MLYMRLINHITKTKIGDFSLKKKININLVSVQIKT